MNTMNPKTAPNRFEAIEARLDQLQNQIRELQDHVKHLEASMHYNSVWENTER
jgi:prefoldin subunit 5